MNITKIALPILLLAILILVVFLRPWRGGTDEPHRTPRPAEPASSVAATGDAGPPADSDAGGRRAAPSSVVEQAAGRADLSAAYESEEFSHVPEWIPRPMEAISANAVDASLRSDGYQEGTIVWLFGDDHETHVSGIRQSLEGSGLSRDDEGARFSTDSPPRQATLAVERVDGARTRVSLAYAAVDHEKGCACPTCDGGLPE